MATDSTAMHQNFDWRAGVRRVAALLCIALLAALTTAAAAHIHHSDSPEDAAHCALCLAAHHPAIATTQAVAPVSVPLQQPAPVIAAPRLAACPTEFPHESRPPPALLTAVA